MPLRTLLSSLLIVAGVFLAVQPAPAQPADPADIGTQEAGALVRPETPTPPAAATSPQPSTNPAAAANGAASANAPATGAAATTATQPAAKPPADAVLSDTQRQNIKSLLDTLKDDAARNDFVRRLETLVEVGTPAAGKPVRDDWLSGATTALGSFSTSVLGLVGDIRNLPEEMNTLFASLSKPWVVQNISWAGAMVAAALMAALLAEWLVKALLNRARRKVESRTDSVLVARIILLCVRTIIDVLPIAAFAAAAYGVLALADLNFLVRLAVVTVVNANVLARAIIAAARAVFSPNVRNLRMVPLGDESAAYGFLWARRFTNVCIYGYFPLRAAWILGLSSAAYTLFSDLLAFIVAGMAIVFVLQIRKPVAQYLRHVSTPTGYVASLRNRIAEFWHLLVIAYVVAAYFVWVMRIDGGTTYIVQSTVLSIVTVVVARLLTTGLLRIFRAVFKLNQDVQEQFPLLELRANRYIPVLKQGVQIVISAVTVLVLFEIWGAQPFEWLATPEGQGLLGRVISISIVALVALLAWEVGTAFSNRIAQSNPNSTRLKTLLPFLLNGFRILLLTIGGLMVLSEIGVDIAPLLAGAGVLGLAVGFGAQTLVKDVITGIFILMEDTLSVGEVVELGSHSGVVEKITIRTVHLRDFDGNVHSLPFGEVQVVKNMSKQFAFAVVDVTVSYRENIDEALAVMAEVAEEMVNNSPLSDTIIAPFEVVGVEGLQDSAVWLRGRFKTRPLGQWNVRREFYRRIKAAFDARGIEIPFPHQTIYFGVDKKGNAPPVHVVQDAQAAAPRRGARKAAEGVEPPPAVQAPESHIEEYPGARERPNEHSEDLDVEVEPPEREDERT